MKNRALRVQGFVAGVCVTAVIVALFPLLLLRQESVSDSEEMAWKTITIGGVATFEVPETCITDPGAGTTYLACPTDENPTPTPEMTFSSDGVTVNVRRWEGLESPYWDHVIASMTVLQPMTRDITINIDK